MRIVKGGPFVGAEIRNGTHPDAPDRSQLWETLVNGKHIRSPSPDPVAAGVFVVWLSGTPIDEAEYRYLIADREWCARNAPQTPEANPSEAAKVGSIDPEYFRP